MTPTHFQEGHEAFIDCQSGFNKKTVASDLYKNEMFSKEYANVQVKDTEYSWLSDKSLLFIRNVLDNLNPKYSRGGNHGEGYVGVKEVIKMISSSSTIPYYSDETRNYLLQIGDQIQQRMRVKISEAYLQHALRTPYGAKNYNPLLKVVLPEVEELSDTTGDIDPSNQNRYSPIPGLLHKYEMLLAYVSINCSSHCRYCYRSDLFNGSSTKSKANMEMIADYIRIYNNIINEVVQTQGKRDRRGTYVHDHTGEPLLPIREILFSGGDPMVLPNATLARYMALVAEAGVKTIRIGTKELVFNPQRFDQPFWKMMDQFHATFPNVRVEFVGHYIHPYELVDPLVDTYGEYLYDINEHYTIREDLRTALTELNQRRDWLGHFNQFPIIDGINNRSDILQLLMYLSNRLGITLHNIYACREIVGNRHFRGHNTIMAQYQLLEEAKSGLSGLENHGRLIMSTEYGKTEVIAADNEKVLLRLNRFVHANKPNDTLIEVDLTKFPTDTSFYWLTDEVINTAVNQNGREILAEIAGEDKSLVKQLKHFAATSISNEKIDGAPKEKTGPAVIEVVNAFSESRLITVDLSDYDKDVTLATILAEHGEIEAACGEHLSCCTCAGKIGTKFLLPNITSDEADLLDSITGNLSQVTNQIRLSCQIPLNSGYYRFIPFDDLSKVVSDTV